MSSEDFKSFIVTNPDLVDEGIDISGLRTNTDASILGNIPDYGGIQYEAYNPNRLSDLMRLYSGGFPMLDTPQATQDFTGGQMIDTGNGSMDQATGGLDTTQPFQDLVDPDVNIDEFATEDTTMPSMLSPDMGASMVTDTTPINMSPLTSEQFVDTTSGLDDVDINLIDQPFADTPVVLGSGNNALGLQDPQSLAIGPSGAVNLQTGPGIDDLLDDATLTSAQAPVEQAPPGIMNPYDPSQSTILGQPGIDRFDEGEAGIDLDPSAGIEDIPVELPATNIETEFEPQAVNTILGPDGITYDAVTGNPIYEDLDAQAAATTLELNQIQDESLKGQLSEIFTSAKDLGLSAIETAQKLVDKGIGTYNDLNQTVTVPGLGEIDVGKTLGGLALNTIVGAPISLVIYALDALGIEGGRGDVSDALGEKYGMDDIGRLTGGPMAGYSVGPDHAQTVQDRIDSIENRTAPQTDASRQKIAELKAYKSEVIATGSSGVITEPGTVVGPGELGTQEIFDEFNQTPTEKADKEAGVDTGDASVAEDIAAADRADTAPPSDPYSGGEGGVQSGMNTPSATADDYDFSDFDEGDDSRADPTGTGNFSDTVTGNDTSPGATGGEGGAGTGGSPKIVCTMMNESYGFGSFRNKIWMKFHKDLSPEYQKGYHKLFLPLVKLSKTNKVVKKVLEHIAVHSTIDMRQATRGKTHLLGRVYRKIILPLCYWAGKND
jgi:hypothetical protein